MISRLILPVSLPCLVLLWSFYPFQAHSDEVNLTRVKECHSGAKDFSVYKQTDGDLKDGDSVTVFTSDLDAVTGLHRTTSGIWRSDLKIIELPTYWNPKAIPLQHCQDGSQAQSISRFVRSLTQIKTYDAVRMYVVAYFIVGEPRDDMDLDEMVRDCQAFPLKLSIICETDDRLRVKTEPPDPMACRRVRILDKIIPVQCD
jgi:hypothetical protein